MLGIAMKDLLLVDGGLSLELFLRNEGDRMG